MAAASKTGKNTSSPASASASAGATYDGFTEEERAAMKERAKELKPARRGGRAAKADPEAELLAKVAEMPDEDRALAERIHALVREAAPELTPKTWYGMPAYAKDGKVVCFFQSAHKFKSRYATLGFNDTARLDEGSMWPTAYAVKELTPADEELITALVRRAVS
ncbi:iron chaperone [Streptomyces sp. Da 82-17]|uniref:iron chaperone n=1 Tax=Streptomyces sp. Da 82-17 TaxID=3377116 RepID=UPI0038D4C02B